MTGADIPRRVRVATTMIWLMALAGLLLVLDGLWELHWWGSPSAHHLLALVDSINKEFGVDPPALLRGRAGAWGLVVLGVVTMVPAALARAVQAGSRAARSWVLAIAIGTLVVGLLFIGADSTEPVDLRIYLGNMHQGIASERIPEILAAVYPGWYQWAEDIAQGLQALAAAATIGTLVSAVIWHSDWFLRRRAAEPEADAWDDAISRLHKRTVGDSETRG